MNKRAALQSYPLLAAVALILQCRQIKNLWYLRQRARRGLDGGSCRQSILVF
jgi:hypothetical protein